MEELGFKVKSFFTPEPVANCVPLLENWQSTCALCWARGGRRGLPVTGCELSRWALLSPSSAEALGSLCLLPSESNLLPSGKHSTAFALLLWTLKCSSLTVADLKLINVLKPTQTQPPTPPPQRQPASPSRVYFSLKCPWTLPVLRRRTVTSPATSVLYLWPAQECPGFKPGFLVWVAGSTSVGHFQSWVCQHLVLYGGNQTAFCLFLF